VHVSYKINLKAGTSPFRKYMFENIFMKAVKPVIGES